MIQRYNIDTIYCSASTTAAQFWNSDHLIHLTEENIHLVKFTIPGKQDCEINPLEYKSFQDLYTMYM
jgi:hypothetical protein